MRSITSLPGRGSETFRQLTTALANARGKMKPLFWPGLEGPFRGIVERLSRRRDNLGHAASLLKVFLPYLVWNTVFDNSRVVAELGRAPAPFSSYCFPLLRFARENRFRYPYREWPEVSVHASRPAAESQDSERSRTRERRRAHAMTDLMLRSVGGRVDRANQARVDARRAASAWKPGEPLEAALRRIQRHAQHRIGRARGGDAAAGAASARRR